MDMNILPHHVAIIADGNRRWAKRRRLPTFEGHRRGFNAIHAVSKRAHALGIPVFTVWVFSTENWKRTVDEVGYLMKLFEQTIDTQLNEAMHEKTRIVHIGRKDRIPDTLRKKIEYAQEQTKQFDKFYFVIALDYGGKDEVLRAINRLGKKAASAPIEQRDIDSHLDTSVLPYPNPDLIIRTSGEKRTSGFMLWQGAYAEYMFIEKHCPEFEVADFDECLKEYALRQRRFGI